MRECECERAGGQGVCVFVCVCVCVVVVVVVVGDTCALGCVRRAKRDDKRGVRRARGLCGRLELLGRCEHLRCNVLRRADVLEVAADDAEHGPKTRVGARVRRGLLLEREHARGAKVGELHHRHGARARLDHSGHEKVLVLEVAVRDVVRVQVGRGQQQLPGDEFEARVRRRARDARRDPAPEVTGRGAVEVGAARAVAHAAAVLKNEPRAAVRVREVAEEEHDAAVVPRAAPRARAATAARRSYARRARRRSASGAAAP